MPEDQKTGHDADVNDNKTVAALSYLWILFLVPLLLKRDSKFAQHHAKQGLILFIVEVVVWIILWIPLVNFVVVLAIIVLAAMGVVKALAGEWWKMPFLGQYAKKFNI